MNINNLSASELKDLARKKRLQETEEKYKDYHCWQWIIQDKQEMCCNKFFLTKNYYSSEEEIIERLGGKNSEGLLYFRPVRPLEESHHEGWLAYSLVNEFVNKDEL